MKLNIIHKVQSTTPRSVPVNDNDALLKVRLPKTTKRRLKKLKAWYKLNLNVTVTVAFLVRDFIDEGLDREHNAARKAERGRYHARIRKLEH